MWKHHSIKGWFIPLTDPSHETVNDSSVMDVTSPVEVY